jgi:hypothetical protein
LYYIKHNLVPRVFAPQEESPWVRGCIKHEGTVECLISDKARTCQVFKNGFERPIVGVHWRGNFKNQRYPRKPKLKFMLKNMIFYTYNYKTTNTAVIYEVVRLVV